MSFTNKFGLLLAIAGLIGLSVETNSSTIWAIYIVGVSIGTILFLYEGKE